MVINRNIINDLEELTEHIHGEIFLDEPTRILYATDASVYREIPQAVAYPKNELDIRELVEFAKKHNASLIPRGAGTSIAGQVVGYGIVVDVGKYMNNILEINTKERWVRVQPGVVLDELNLALEPEGLFFSPETSTSDRCMIGGMVGNNSCGAHSLVYGNTRDHLISVRAVLSNSSVAEFDPLTKEEFEKKCELKSLEGELYQHIIALFSEPDNRKQVFDGYPDKSIKRRNTGYALDLLLDAVPFGESDKKFNFSKLLAGSEGTLAFFTEFKLHLDPIPTKNKGLVCAHFTSLEDALKGNLIALKYNPIAVELIDKTVMDLSKENITQRKNRFFIQGDPGAMLIIEFAAETHEEISKAAGLMEKEMKNTGYGYHFPLITGDDMVKVWSVRKAGLGLLTNMKGDAKPVPFVEDTSVKVDDLPNYVADFKKILDKYDLKCAYFAHIGAGELHFRPVLNLKKKPDVELLRKLAIETALLVNKYEGTLSGEHGDGRLRSEFIPLIIGEINFEFLSEIKRIWDPENIFNEGKIFNAPQMNTSLRYHPEKSLREVETTFDFSEDHGFLSSIEKCSGSGDCRKSVVFGGMMCPSYQATKDEKTTTRARANTLREMITWTDKSNPFGQNELFDVLDLCLSCKGCKSECPSNVDMAKLKAEFLSHYYDVHPVPFRTKLFAHYFNNFRIATSFPVFTNFLLKNQVTSGLIKKLTGIALKRNLPLLYKTTLQVWLRRNLSNLKPKSATKGKVHFYVDEFTDLNDTAIGITAIKLLLELGYEVNIPPQSISGRTYISKGLLSYAHRLAEQNIKSLKDVVSIDVPLVGIEPSTILTFRDEYPDLMRGEMKASAIELGQSSLLFEEFITREMEKGNIQKDQFTAEHKEIRVHGHCQQKAIASTKETLQMLSLPENYIVEEIPSGCCGMAGSFGYEKEHYELSMSIGELILFPEIRKTKSETLIAASGTSCRCQIVDGTNRQALHPVEILYDALRK